MMSPMDNLGWINSPKIITIFFFRIKTINKKEIKIYLVEVIKT